MPVVSNPTYATGDVIEAVIVNNLRDDGLLFDGRTGGDPATSNKWLQSTGALGAAWVARATAVLDAIGFTPANKAGDTFTGSVNISGATSDLSVGRNIAAAGGISGATVSSAGAVAGVTGTFSGAVSAAGGYGAVAGTTGTFSGALGAASLSSSGAIAAVGAISGASISSAGAIAGVTGTFSGAVSAAGGYGAVAGTTATFSGALAAASVSATGAIAATAGLSGASLSVTGAISGTTITGSSTVQGTQLISTVATGTAPFVAASTTLVANLRAATAALADDSTLLAGVAANNYARGASGTYTGNGATTARQMVTGFGCKAGVIHDSSLDTMYIFINTTNSIRLAPAGTQGSASVHLHATNGFVVADGTAQGNVNGNTYTWTAFG